MAKERLIIFDTTMRDGEQSPGAMMTLEEKLRIAFNRQRQVIGTPAQCKAKLLSYAEKYGVDEVVIVTITHDFAARLKSYELLAREFGLAPR